MEQLSQCHRPVKICELIRLAFFVCLFFFFGFCMAGNEVSLIARELTVAQTMELGYGNYVL